MEAERLELLAAAAHSQADAARRRRPRSQHGDGGSDDDDDDGNGNAAAEEEKDDDAGGAVGGARFEMSAAGLTAGLEGAEAQVAELDEPQGEAKCTRPFLFYALGKT